MAKAKMKHREELATLALAKAIVENDAAGARLAIADGADPSAFWIDGKTRLRELYKKASFKVSDAVKNLLTPKALQKIPPWKEDRDFWTDDFAVFVAKRGYAFRGRTVLASGLNGSEVKGLTSAKAAASRISSKWELLSDAYCKDEPAKNQSRWHFEFRSTWTVDRRIAGFWMTFTVDAPSWTILELFEDAKAKGGEALAWPGISDPLIANQKNWEGNCIFYQLWEKDEECEISELRAGMQKGGNPFTKVDGKFLDAHYQNPVTIEFMQLVRDALVSEDGWYLRLPPLLIDGAFDTLQEKAALNVLTLVAPPIAKPVKQKTLKNRRDIL